MVRKLLAPAIAAAMVLVTAGIVLAWAKPILTAECAEDANHYEWKINLHDEANFKIDWSFDSGFASMTSHDFVTAGDHEFITVRGGPILYVRWHDDTSKTAQADANGEVCVQPSVEQSVAESVPASVAQSVAESVAESVPASVAQSVAASAEQSVEAGTGTPQPSIPNGALSGNGSSPLPTVIFSLVLLASLGTLAYTNVRVARTARRDR
jgi:hypothetical protein